MRDEITGRVYVAGKPFDIVAVMKYFGPTLTNLKYWREEIKGRLNSGIFFCNSIQNILTTVCFLRIRRQLWSLRLREEHRLRALEVESGGARLQNDFNKRFTIFGLHRILLW